MSTYAPPNGYGPLFAHRPAEPEPPTSIDQRFEEFHRANRWVYEELVAMARRWRGEQLEAGRAAPRGSIEPLVGAIRWQHRRRTLDPNSTFRFNDHFTSRFARLIAEQEPDLADFFETRRLRS